jgi:hypothetical protein
MIFKGKWEYVIYFLVCYFPVYIVFLSLAYHTTESLVLVKGLQFFKDFIVLISVVGFLIYQKNILQHPFRLTVLDKLFLSFLGLSLFFLIAPIGAASLIDKVLYFKGILIPCLVYFLGRNTNFNSSEASNLFKLIFAVVTLGFAVNLFEVILDTHFQTLTGYAIFNESINKIEHSGNFGLSWTFETQAMTKRFASIYSDPLELSSSVLMGFAAALIFFLKFPRLYLKWIVLL